MKKKTTSSIFTIALLAVAMLFIAACTKAPTEATAYNNTQTVKTTTTPPPEYVSFSNILNTADKKIKEVSIRGYLKEEQIPLAGRMDAFSDNYFVVDDDNNKVELSFVDPNSITGKANTELQKYFITNQTTKNAFSITGELQWNFEKPIIYLKTIN